MDDKKRGTLSVSIKKSEILVITDGEEVIEIAISDRYKQPIMCRVRINSSKKYEIKRRPSGGS